MKVKGRINGPEGAYWVVIDGIQGWSALVSGFKSSKLIAKAAAERLAKKLNLEIEWEGE